MHALSISALLLERPWCKAGQPADCLQENTHRLVSRKAVAALRRIPSRSAFGRVVANVGRGPSGVCDQYGGSSPSSQNFYGSFPRRRLLRIARANGTLMIVQA